MAYGIDRTHIGRGIISYHQGNDERAHAVQPDRGRCVSRNIGMVGHQAGKLQTGSTGFRGFLGLVREPCRVMTNVRAVMQNQHDVIKKGAENYNRTGRLNDTSGAASASQKLRIFVNYILNNSGFNVLRNRRGLSNPPTPSRGPCWRTISSRPRDFIDQLRNLNSSWHLPGMQSRRSSAKMEQSISWTPISGNTGVSEPYIRRISSRPQDGRKVRGSYSQILAPDTGADDRQADSQSQRLHLGLRESEGKSVVVRVLLRQVLLEAATVSGHRP